MLKHHSQKPSTNQPEQSEPRFEVVAEAEEVEEAARLVEALQPDILVLDLVLEGRSGFALLKELTRSKPNILTIVLSMLEEEHRVRQSFQCGACGYVRKADPPQSLIEAFKTVLAGERYVSPFFNNFLQGRALHRRSEDGKEDPLAILSARDREVFFQLAEGVPNREIAERLDISPRTVETHRARLMKKLGFKSNVSLVKFAIGHDLMISSAQCC